MATQVLVQDDVARRLDLLLLALVGPFEPMTFGEAALRWRAVAGHETMLVVGLAMTEAVVPARPIHELPAEVELAHGLPCRELFRPLIETEETDTDPVARFDAGVLAAQVGQQLGEPPRVLTVASLDDRPGVPRLAG
jgi:hypothetical protein